MRTPVLPEGASAGEERVPARIRAFVWLFLAAFALCGFAKIEAWPLTGWRLFSELRNERTSSWRAMRVSASGAETRFSFGDLPAGYHWGANILSGFATRPAAEQTAACDAWAEAARSLGLDVAAIRIYRLERLVSDRVGHRGAPEETATLVFSCGNGGIRIEAFGA
ncbi:MAG: hypothetical protein WEB06_18815 [Actinomycetota bacterium]